LRGKEILLIGAGEMAQLALKHLQSRGMNQLSMANRNKERAARLLPNGIVYGLDELPQALAAADLVFTATSASQPIITAALAQQVIAQRDNRPLAIIDLALPRDVAPAVAHLRGVQLYDVDDLQTQVDEALWQRERAIPQVEKIIAAELKRYPKQQREAAVTPLIADLHQRAEQIRQRELERTLRFLPADLDDQTRQQFEQFSQSLIKKLLHEPTARLRQEAANGHAKQYAESMRFLFDIEG
jgi:glutamyl-tRNA reductase